MAVGDQATTPEDTPVTIPVLANDTDIDSDLAQAGILTLTAAPAHGVVTVNPDGTLTYTPNLNFLGTDNFKYTVSDGQAPSNEAVVTLTVTPVNDATVAVGESYTIDEDQVLTVPLSGVLARHRRRERPAHGHPRGWAGAWDAQPAR